MMMSCGRRYVSWRMSGGVLAVPGFIYYSGGKVWLSTINERKGSTGKKDFLSENEKGRRRRQESE
jgi:hypothetical protein